MNNVKELINKFGTDSSGKWMSVEKVEQLVNELDKEHTSTNKRLSHELLGVIVDTEEGDGFDHVCLDTVKRVHNILAGSK